MEETRDMTKAEQRAQAIRACLILLALIVCLFLWLSILTFSPLDAPNTFVYPHAEPALNACGRAGAYVAFKVFEWFGVGAFAAAAGVTLAFSVVFYRGYLPNLWQRVIGVALLVTVTSALATIFTGGQSPTSHLESGDRLAFGSTTDGLWISETGGDTWACVSHTLPPVYAVRFA